MDFQARQYDPQIGRFLAVDPLADAGGQQVWSPYAAMGNAPESNVDPDGTFSRNLTQADLSAADMLTYNRPVFFPTASLYMPGGALFKSGIGSIFDGKSWGGLTGSALENYVNTHTTQAASIMGEVFETGSYATVGQAIENGIANYNLAMDRYEAYIRSLDFSANGVGSLMLTYDPKGPKSIFGVLDSWSNNFGNWLGSVAKSSPLGTAYNAADRKLKNHGTDKYEGQDGFRRYGLPTMKATFAFNLTVVTGGMGGLSFITYGNIAFAGDNVLDVGTGGKYSIAALSRQSSTAFKIYNAGSIGFGLWGNVNSQIGFMRAPTVSTYLLKATDNSMFMFYWAPSAVNGIYNYKK